ncbi:MAG TPA: SHOCT domain-containing protein [Ferrovibrio sp.]|jgi:putative membrane protein|uniref:SHOCT domain-containing protein n=1 Tax=Ferrovibrio sp. TaxID=1917215 RepID=UPI002ED14909
MYWNGPYHAMGWGGWWMPWHGIAALLLLALVILGIVVLIRSLSGREASRRPPLSAGLSLLEERYARGEIQRDEYLQKKRDILGP